jgi:hypothetical protein
MGLTRCMQPCPPPRASFPLHRGASQVIHKGKKLAEGDVLPWQLKPCTLLVIENSAAGAVDTGAAAQKGTHTRRPTPAHTYTAQLSRADDQ